MAQDSGTRFDAVQRYTGMPGPDRRFDLIAGMAATVFDAPMAAVTVVDRERVWFLATKGLGDVTQVSAASGLSASAIEGGDVLLVQDTTADAVARRHPLVHRAGVRFYAGAPIVSPEGHRLGTVDVFDRKRRRRVTDAQTQLLRDLAAVAAQMLGNRLAALTAVRTEQLARAADADLRDAADSLREQLAEAAAAEYKSVRPEWCQLGVGGNCSRKAEVKIADTWGDSAWGCWEHAEEALMNVPSVYVATESDDGLAGYRARKVQQADG